VRAAARGSEVEIRGEASLHGHVTLRLAVLGDSVAFGVGASRASETLAHRLVAALATAGVPAEPRVFAVPGAVSADLAAQVERARAWRPDVAVIVVGANDLTRLVPPDRAAAALGSAVRELRSAGVRVVVAPAPDLSVVPHVPPAFQAIVRLGSQALRGAQVRAAAHQGAYVADAEGTTSAAFARDPALFSADRFHPSGAGYGLIAAALAPVVVEAAREAARQAGRDRDAEAG
jgi:lysophospholipase L1-like esterase